MADAALQQVLRRDRLVVASALLLVTALCWAYLVGLASRMHDPGTMGMGAGGMDAMGMASMAPGVAPWTPAEFALAAAMWTVMMIGMMTPSVAPMVLLYARVGRQAAAQGRPFAAAGWFAGGYLLSWAAFALLAAATQGAVEGALAVPLSMTGLPGVLGGIVLAAAGLYQWTPLKNSCLAHCQAPLLFIQRHGGFRGDPAGALRLGMRHGLYCVGCCWALMALLFVGGVMNLLWVGALTALVLLEKLVPPRFRLSRLAGAGLVAAGVLLTIRALAPVV